MRVLVACLGLLFFVTGCATLSTHRAIGEYSVTGEKPATLYTRDGPYTVGTIDGNDIRPLEVSMAQYLLGGLDRSKRRSADVVTLAPGDYSVEIWRENTRRKKRPGSTKRTRRVDGPPSKFPPIVLKARSDRVYVLAGSATPQIQDVTDNALTE